MPRYNHFAYEIYLLVLNVGLTMLGSSELERKEDRKQLCNSRACTRSVRKA